MDFHFLTRAGDNKKIGNKYGPFNLDITFMEFLTVTMADNLILRRI